MKTYTTLAQLRTFEYKEDTKNWSKEPEKDGLYYIMSYKPVLFNNIPTTLILKVPIVNALDVIEEFVMEPEGEIQVEYVKYLISQGNNITIKTP